MFEIYVGFQFRWFGAFYNKNYIHQKKYQKFFSLNT